MDITDGEIVIAMLGLLATTIGAIIWVVKYLARSLSKDLREHTKAAMGQIESNKKLGRAVDKSTESSQEVLDFMKNLNGKLATATIQTVKEQHIDTQIIKHDGIIE